MEGIDEGSAISIDFSGPMNLSSHCLPNSAEVMAFFDPPWMFAISGGFSL